jgi:hypothetical protein
VQLRGIPATDQGLRDLCDRVRSRGITMVFGRTHRYGGKACRLDSATSRAQGTEICRTSQGSRSPALYCGAMRRDVIPTDHQVASRGKTCVAVREGDLALLSAIEPPSINPITNDEIEKTRLEVIAQLLEPSDDVLLRAIPACLRVGLDRPVIVGCEEPPLVPRGVVATAYKQHPSDARIDEVSWDDDLLKYAPIVRVDGRRQPQSPADEARQVTVLRQERDEQLPSGVPWQGPSSGGKDGLQMRGAPSPVGYPQQLNRG